MPSLGIHTSLELAILLAMQKGIIMFTNSGWKLFF